MSTEGRGKPATKYFVNGEEQDTLEPKSTMQAIVEGAGFSPAADYTLQEDNTHKEYRNPSDEVHVHQGERFTVTYTGTTPTS